MCTWTGRSPLVTKKVRASSRSPTCTLGSDFRDSVVKNGLGMDSGIEHFGVDEKDQPET